VGVNTLGTARGPRAVRGVRAWWPAGRGVGTDRLLRNGHLLTVSSLLASSLGAGYWVLVTRWYSPSSVGRGYSAVSAMMFLAGLGQLNLANTLVRFVPTAGVRTRLLIVRIYAAAAVATTVLAVAFVFAVPLIAPQLGFLRAPLWAAGFVAASTAYALFVLQDGALTGLRRADWVVLENALFAVVKVGFLVLFALEGSAGGILLSWYAALGVSLAVTNRFLFARAIPGRTAPTTQETAAARPSLGYLATDLAGSMFWLAAITLPPIIVLRMLGPADSAYFSLCWVIAYALYQLSANMGSSLIVESADDPARLAVNARRVLLHTSVLVPAAVLVLVVAAPWVLDLFGPGYAAGGTAALRLLALSAIPNLVLATAVSACRARRRLRPAAIALGVVCAGSLALTVVLLPVMGIAGAGLAWLAWESAVALVLVCRPSWWLGSTRPRAGRASIGEIASAAHRRAVGVAQWPGDRVAAFRTIRSYDGGHSVVDSASAARTAVRTNSDLLIVRAPETRDVALKCPRTDSAVELLARQTAVLGFLGADHRLGQWRALLPRTDGVAKDAGAPRHCVTECWLPGITGSAILRDRPKEAEALIRHAATAIAPLHRVTGRGEQIGPFHLARWIDRPLDVVEQHLPPAGTVPGDLHRVRERLDGLLRGREIEVGWTHRDYHPGNVLYDPRTHEVTGIVDWGGALRNGPTAVDLEMFALATRHETTGLSIGRLVAQAVGAEERDEGLLLLAWLWHVADNLEKSLRYQRNTRWIAHNVVNVLRVLRTVGQ
jgi:O-antigen/teichoic acid export membrane protein/aminoglycoside phosphotransferase (APT) family kinase protein